MRARNGWILCLLVLPLLAAVAVAEEEAPVAEGEAPETEEEAPVETIEEGIEASGAEEAKPKPPTWTTTIDLGAYWTGGNTNTRGASLFGNVTRDSESDAFQTKLSSLYGEQDGERNINEHILSFQHAVKALPSYWFAFLSFEHDEFEGVDLRTVFSPGAGHVFLDEETRKLRGEIGPSVQHEYRRKPRRQEYDTTADYQAALDDWDESVWTPQVRVTGYGEVAVFEKAKVTEEVEWFPGYRSGVGYTYRVSSVTTFVQPLSETWNFKLTFIYRYNSDVGKDVDRHDLKVVLSLGIKL